MNTETRRKASAAYHAKRTAEGYRKVTVWLHADTRDELAVLAKTYGSKDAAASMAILHYRSTNVVPRGLPASVVAPAARVSAPTFSHGRAKTVQRPEKAPGVDVPVLARPAFNPQPKSGRKR